MESSGIINFLKSQRNQKNIDGMARFGISPKNTLGVSVGSLRKYAKEIKQKVPQPEELHKIALEIWKSGIHEAKMLATILAQPKLMTEEMADLWVADIDSWDICDGFCANLIWRTGFAFKKIEEWALREEEFVRRAAFSLLAILAVHDKKASDSQFVKLFPLIKKYSLDERNFVRKSVNWALRQVGKRNTILLKEAIELAKEVEKLDSKSAKWIAKDALRELNKRL